MGADFMFSINEIKLTKDEAYKKAEKYVNNSLQETIDFLVDQCGCYHLDFPVDQSNENTSLKVYKYLTECIDTVYNYKSLRDCSSFTIDSVRTFAITGGMSWGDEPSTSYNSFNVCEGLGLTE